MTWSKHNILFPSASLDTLLLWLLRITSGFAAGLVLLILFFLLAESSPILRNIPAVRFVTDPSWQPSESAYNLAPMLSGTLYAAGGGLLLATPLGMASALFVA
jgi:phosphate transport system permease protein